MSTLKIKPKKSKVKKHRGTDNFEQDMLFAVVRNFEGMKGLSPEGQGVAMSTIFDANDVVFAAFPDMSKPHGSDFAIIKGSTEEILKKPGLAARGIMMTAFAVDHRAEAELFQAIYEWRQREIDSQGKASEEMERFWACMTPAGRIKAGPGATAKEWAALMEDIAGAASLLDKVMRNMRSAN